jgi:ribosome-associated protein
MELQKLQRIVVDALEDVKGQDIKVFNTVGLSDMFDRVVLASGTSNRQTRALASNVAEKVKAAGGKVVSVEGTESGEWVLVDLGDIVVHIMQPAIRQYYELEEMWGSKPVRLKLESERIAARKTAVRGDGTVSSAGKPIAKAASFRQSTTRKPAARKSAAKKTAARKAAPKKSAPARSTTRKVAAKKTVAKKATARTTARARSAR